MVSTSVKTIADLVQEFGITARTIRFYEAEGMIAPERQGTQRLYHPRDCVRLKLILRGKRLGFSLAEIRDIIDLYDTAPGEVAQLEFFLAKIEERNADLRQKQKDIELTLHELADVAETCRTRLKQLGQKQLGQKAAAE